ncbi:MAG: flagellar assembly protein FliW [Janthinobacterium lividum]
MRYNFTTGTQEIINPNLYTLNNLNFEHGLPGYEHITQFKLNSLEDQGFFPLHLLSDSHPCVGKAPVAFIVVGEESSGLEPLSVGQREIISTALKIKSFFEVYYLITLEKTSKMLTLMANVRAPLIIDPVTHKGCQYIFNDTTEEVSCLLQDLSIMIHQNRLRQRAAKA